MANLSSQVGFTPVQTRVTLANNGVTNVQDFSAYDGQEVTGFVYVDAASDYRAIVKVSVLKTGSGAYDVATEDVSGDLFSGNPIVSFSMSGSILQATLPNITGYVTAYIQYNLNAPALGSTFPLSIDSSNIISNIFTASSVSGFTFRNLAETSIVTFSDTGSVAIGPNSNYTVAHYMYGTLDMKTSPSVGVGLLSRSSAALATGESHDAVQVYNNTTYYGGLGVVKTSSTSNAASVLALKSNDGTIYYFWVNDSGVLRYSSTANDRGGQSTGTAV